MSHLFHKSNESIRSPPNPSTSERLSPIKQRETCKLDQKMLDIINNGGTKSERLHQAIIEFESLIMNKLSMPTTPSERDRATESKSVTEPISDVNPLLVGVPSKYQKKASVLLKHLIGCKKLDNASSGGRDT